MRPGQVQCRIQSGWDGDFAIPTRHMVLRQLGLYLIVGVVCFFIDIGGFVVLRLCELPILLASALSFTTATLVNYSLCCSFVFRRGRFSRPEEIVRLFVIALVGLGLNSVMVLLLARILGLNPTLAKILAPRYSQCFQCSPGIISDDAHWFSTTEAFPQFDLLLQMSDKVHPADALTLGCIRGYPRYSLVMGYDEVITAKTVD
jgi:putative flippase GtrA